MNISGDREELDMLLYHMNDDIEYGMDEQNYGKFLMKEAARELAAINPVLSRELIKYLTEEFYKIN